MAKNIRRNNKISAPLTFKANIPKEILSQQKYANMLNAYREYGRNSAYLYDTNILKSLQSLKSDDSVSEKFKSRLLLDNDNSYFISRVEDSKNNRDSRKNDFNFNVINAMLMASPDEETTKMQLLTPRRQNGKTYGIPLHYANAKIANLLLCSSPDDDTLKKQLLFRDEKGNIPFANADDETRIVMLEACDNETKIKLLSDPSVIFKNGDFSVSTITDAKSILDSDDFPKARLAMIQAQDPKNGRNVLHSTNNNLEALIKICSRHPELFKTLLLQEDSEGKIPTETQLKSNRENSLMLLEASPDDETFYSQLFHENDGKLLIDGLKEDCYFPIVNSSCNVDRTIQKTMFYDNGKDKLPFIANLSSTKIVNILNKLSNPDIKKEILLAYYAVDENSGKYITADIIQHTLHSDKYKEYIANNVLETIQADSTTYNEALDLIKLYKPCVDEISKETFEAIENYILENDLAE